MTDVYERLTELADEASWYRDEQQDAAEQADHLSRQAQDATGADRWRLHRVAAAKARHAALAGRLAAQVEATRAGLLEELPDVEPQTVPVDHTPEDPRVELGLRLHDALAREHAAAREANACFEAVLAAWPWQRARRETAWLRGRYAESCVHAHTRTAALVRAEIDALVRARLGLT
ncbi:hypothetical protein [Nocardiopsis dassonvillei]|uniref:hypothetical protein n=1 Tax=Nocardiopsis dassonvillei TaxID=2014 RepID=UPI003670B9D9